MNLGNNHAAVIYLPVRPPQAARPGSGADCIGCGAYMAAASARTLHIGPYRPRWKHVVPTARNIGSSKQTAERRKTR